MATSSINKITGFEKLPIASNTDLNSVTKAGVYYSGNGTITNTLVNCPVTGSGFAMIVMEKGYSTDTSFQTGVQVIFTSTEMHFRASYSGGWDEWASVITGDLSNVVNRLPRSNQSSIDSIVSSVSKTANANISIIPTNATICASLGGGSESGIALMKYFPTDNMINYAIFGKQIGLGKINTSTKAITIVQTYPSVAIDISDQFTYQLTDGNPVMHAYYDPSTKMVTGSFILYGATAFATNVAIYTIASAYRPKANITVGAVVQNASGVGVSKVTIYASGRIEQKYSATATGVQCNFSYSIA